MKKPITFKSAIFVVIGLHVVGFFAMVGLGSYNGKVAREAREKKRQSLASKDTSKEWPVSNNVPKVVSAPPPKPAPSPRSKTSIASAAIGSIKTASLDKKASDITKTITEQSVVALNTINKNITQKLKTTKTTKPKINNIEFKPNNVKRDDVIIVDAQFLQNKLNGVIIPVY